MAKELTSHIRAALFHSIRICYRSARDYPFLAGALFSLLLLYRCFPSLFAFLLSSSPVIAITTLLLGLLLSYGDPNLPEIEHDATTTTTQQQISSLKASAASDDLVVRNDDETRTVEAHAETSSPSSDESSSSSEDEEEKVSLLTLLEQQYEAAREVSGEGLTVKVDKPYVEEENIFDSSLGSPWQPVDIDGDASSDSDRAESSSPDASMADIMPMLDELHPLLDAEAPHPLLKSVDIWDAAAAAAASGGSSDEGDKEEHHGEKEVAKEQEAVQWTADDQKNVMDLGISDMERNRRLENLIARRRARRDLRFVAERNLIDLDYGSGMDELSRFQVRIPPISATRRNPFDLPYDWEETGGLPPIPGSAPSALLRRRNPFDLPFDRPGQSGSLTTDNLMPEDLISREDMFFGAHEDLNWRAVFSDGIAQEKSKSDAVENDEFATLQRQSSEESDLKTSSVSEAVMINASIVDQVQHVDLIEQEFLHQESKLLSPHDTNTVGQESSSSTEAASVSAGISASDIQGIDLNAPMAAEAVLLVDDASIAVEEENREERIDFSVIDAAKLEVVQELESSSLEGYEKSFERSTHEESVSMDLKKGDSSKDYSDAIHSLPADFSSPSRLEAGVEVQVADPVYDLSPSGSTASMLNETLLDAGTGGLISPLPSHIEGVVSEEASTPNTLEKNISSGVESESVKDQLSIDHEVFCQPIPPALQISEAIVQSSSLPPMETESSDLVDVATSIISEEDEKIGALNSYSHGLVFSDHLTTYESQIAYQSTDKSAIHPIQEARFDESHIRFPNLPSIPEENVDDFKLNEENEGRMVTPGVIGVTGLQIIEEPIIEFSDIDRELSLAQTMSREETVQETLDTENTSRQVHEMVNNDTSIMSPIASATGPTGESLLEPTKSREYTSQLDTNYEHESHSSPNDSQSLIINKIQGDQDGELPNMLISLDDETDEIHAEVGAVEDIEDLLSELDVVGDFRAELKSDHGDHQEKMQPENKYNDSSSDPLIYEEKQDFVAQMQVPEARSTGLNLTSPDEFYGVTSQLEVMEQVESSSQSYDIDSEMTVYNPKLHVLEACSLEELDTVFKKLREEAVMSSGSELILEQSLITKTELGSNQLDVDDPNLTEADSKMHTLEASSLEELQSVFKKLHEEALLPSGSEPISERSTMVETGVGSGTIVGDPKVTKTDLELQVLEACSVEELDSAFKQLREEGAVPSASKPVVDISETIETEAGSIKLDTAGGEPKQSDTNSELQVLEAESIDDINFDFNQPIERDSENPVISEVEPSQEFVDEPMGAASDLQVVEAKSIEDIHLALKQLTDGTANLPLNLMEPKVGSVVPEATERHLEPEVLEVQSTEKTHLASVEDVSRETGPGDRQIDEKSTDAVVMADVPSTGASNSRMARKGDKSGKSGPSSSSSSSSSSSDSD